MPDSPYPVTDKVSARPSFQRPLSDVPRDKVTILTAPDLSCSSPNPYSPSPPFSRLHLVGKVHWSGAHDPSQSWRLQLRRPSSGSQRWGQHLPPVLLSHRADITFAKQGDQEIREVKVQAGMELASADHEDDLQASTQMWSLPSPNEKQNQLKQNTSLKPGKKRGSFRVTG